MQRLPEELPPQIEQLLLEKNYEDLSLDEIKLVEQYLSKTEYEDFRQILLLARDTFKQENLSPDPRIQSELQQNFRSSKTTSASFYAELRAMLNYPVPAWKAGIASIVFIMGFYFYNLNTNWQPEKTWSNSTTIDSLASNQSRSVKADKELLNLLRGVQ